VELGWVPCGSACALAAQLTKRATTKARSSIVGRRRRRIRQHPNCRDGRITGDEGGNTAPSITGIQTQALHEQHRHCVVHLLGLSVHYDDVPNNFGTWPLYCSSLLVFTDLGLVAVPLGLGDWFVLYVRLTKRTWCLAYLRIRLKQTASGVSRPTAVGQNRSCDRLGRNPLLG
jgi:hypothetical protein